jgi:hypothetical protein
MDKYYKIESVNELLPGLECQVKSDDDEWQNIVFSPDSPFLDLLKTILWAKNVKHGEVRCKYLDEEDIKSLGWNKQDIKSYDMYTIRSENGVYDLVIKKNVLIRQWSAGTEDDNIFYGTIKNKAQLKLIMEMIGI